jgi:hypothetical protein
MTEAEWLAANDPAPMMALLRSSGRVTRRRLRLFATACCRRIWHLLEDEGSRKAVEVAERYADGLATEGERAEAHAAAARAVAASTATFAAGAFGSRVPRRQEPAAVAALWTVGTIPTVRYRVTANAAGEGFPALQAELLRDLFSRDVFRPSRPDALLAPTDGLVFGLARSAYEDRRLPEGTLEPAPLAVLLDALEDAGCTDAELLGHLRSPGPHVRGCWALDLVLGKE